jgi:hypothetical protein
MAYGIAGKTQGFSAKSWVGPSSDYVERVAVPEG